MLHRLWGRRPIRIHEIGYEDRPPTAEDELDRMRDLVQGGHGGRRDLVSGSSLIYAPAFYATNRRN